MENIYQPNQDERVMAALSHASAMIPMMGVIAPIVFWATQKEKSRYVAFQALQALSFQAAMIIAWFIGMGCYIVSFFGTFATTMLVASSGPDSSASPVFALAFMVPVLTILIILVGGFVMIIYGLIGAVMTIQGKPFRYIIIGNRVEKFMQPNAAPDAAPVDHLQ